MSSARALAVVAAAVLVALAAATPVYADADPASDYLLQSDVFYPFGTQVSGTEKSRLDAAVAAAKKARLGLKVAIIAQKSDLGAVTVLYRKPQNYAKFLGTELFYVNKARVLVVMPNGYGLWRRGGPLPANELAAVRALPSPNTTDGTQLATDADTAVRRLLALHGIQVSATASTSNSTTRDRIVIAVAALVLIGIGVGGYALLNLRRRRAHAT